MSMPLSARRTAPSVNIEPFPDRFGASQVVLSANETAAVSGMLRQAKSAIASLRQHVAALEDDLSQAHGRAQAAEERARTEAACRAAEKRALEEKLQEAAAAHDALAAEMTKALSEREHRMWSAEARAQELERRTAEAQERATAAEAREWEAKARLARVRDALGD